MKRLLFFLSSALFVVGQNSFAMEAPAEKKLKNEVYATIHTDGSKELVYGKGEDQIPLSMQESNYSASGTDNFKVIAKKLNDSQSDKVREFIPFNKGDKAGFIIMTPNGRLALYRQDQDSREPFFERKHSAKALREWGSKFEIKKTKQEGSLFFVKYNIKQESKIAVAIYEATKASRLFVSEDKVQETETITDFENIPNAKRWRDLKINKAHHSIVVTGGDKKETKYTIKKGSDNSVVLTKESPSFISTALRRLSFHK